MSGMQIADMHCDTILKLYRQRRSLETISEHINLEKLRRGGALLQCFAVFTPLFSEAEECGIGDDAWTYFNKAQKLFEEQLSLFPETLAPVRCFADIEKNRRQGRISAMLTLEDGYCIDGRIERVQQIYDMGVRMVALTWNYENCIGFPNSSDPELHKKGLKAFGFDVIARMAELGMAVDVSHLSEGGFYDVAEKLGKPFVASHSCARALCDHSRCLTDDQLRTLGDCGGVCGVNFYSGFLNRDSQYTEYGDIMRHIEHIVNAAGIESAALGSDFDGIDCGLEMSDYSGMLHLSELIADRFGYDKAELICSRNVLRVLSEVIK